MTTFIIGLVILFGGGLGYGKFVEHVFKPDDRPTPAIAKEDGVEYVPMSKFKNALIELLNIAGTGPIFGPIMGILFGPIAFILIPIGCVVSGATHDYFAGMISIREGGEQMPSLVGRFMGKGIYQLYNAFLCILMLLVGAVFIYTPGDIFVTGVLGKSASLNSPALWITYAVIFVYYLVATLFPIDKIIGRIYPIFGAILLFSAVGIFFGIFVKDYSLTNISSSALTWHGTYPDGITPIIPVFFVTVACGITSGFHSTQATLIGRSVRSEREGRMTFYNMMILEGFIAMIWAAAAMGVYNRIGIAAGLQMQATGVVNYVAKDMLGSVGGMIALLGIIVLPITSGDTALRSLRLMLGEYLHVDMAKMKNKLGIAIPVFILVAIILFWAKYSPEGFTILWRYFSWANQTLAIFAFAMFSIYLMSTRKGYAWIMTILPGMFYAFVTCAFIMNAQIGFRMSWPLAYGVSAAFTIIYTILIVRAGKKRGALERPLDNAAVS
ncbi:MAG: carbon starvation protein A [Anaerovoracaceae bacterium]|jgi:carbon starvation protein CstA